MLMSRFLTNLIIKNHDRFVSEDPTKRSTGLAVLTRRSAVNFSIRRMV
jgi:hypothetical protein